MEGQKFAMSVTERVKFHTTTAVLVCVCFVVATVLALVIPSRQAANKRAKRAQPSYLDEASALAMEYSRAWEEVRDGFAGDEERTRGREAWRRRYAADLRALCARHGHEPPGWARED